MLQMTKFKRAHIPSKAFLWHSNDNITFSRFRVLIFTFFKKGNERKKVFAYTLPPNFFNIFK